MCKRARARTHTHTHTHTSSKQQSLLRINICHSRSYVDRQSQGSLCDCCFHVSWTLGNTSFWVRLQSLPCLPTRHFKQIQYSVWTSSSMYWKLFLAWFSKVLGSLTCCEYFIVGVDFEPNKFLKATDFYGRLECLLKQLGKIFYPPVCKSFSWMINQY